MFHVFGFFKAGLTGCYRREFALNHLLGLPESSRTLEAPLCMTGWCDGKAPSCKHGLEPAWKLGATGLLVEAKGLGKLWIRVVSFLVILWSSPQSIPSKEAQQARCFGVSKETHHLHINILKLDWRHIQPISQSFPRPTHPSSSQP